MKNKTNWYTIHETIPHINSDNNEKVYCVDKLVDEIVGCPVYTQEFRGSYEECVEYLKKVEEKK